MSLLSGRVPAKLEETVRNSLEAAGDKGQHTEFPVIRLKKIRDNIFEIEDTMFCIQISPLRDCWTIPPGSEGAKTNYLDGLLQHVDTKVLGGDRVQIFDFIVTPRTSTLYAYGMGPITNLRRVPTTGGDDATTRSLSSVPFP